ncbi:MAG: hypothetical protein Q8K75_03975 [Chlamydiales bacterium]|nr:hypothetical protein [Chlamydiales bacterium]
MEKTGSAGDFVILEYNSRPSSPGAVVVKMDASYEGALTASTEEYWGQALERMVTSFCPINCGLSEVPEKPDPLISVDRIRELILNKGGSSRPSPDAILGMLLDISHGLSDIFVHPHLQYALESKLPAAVAAKAKDDPRMIAAYFDLMATSLANPVGGAVEWLNEGRLREYRKRLEASDIAVELRQELLMLGDAYWKGSFEPTLFVREFSKITEKASDAQQIDLGRVMLLLASNTAADSAAAWGELLIGVGQGFKAIATLINRQLSNELKYAPLSIQVRGNVQEPISIEIPFLYKNKTVGHQLEAINNQVIQALRSTLHEAKNGQLEGYLNSQQVEPILNMAAIQVGHSVQTLMEVLIATIARQDCAAATKDLLDIIQQHSMLYIKVVQDGPQQNFLERFKNSGRLSRYGLHRSVENGEDIEFWSEMLAKMPKIFETESTLTLLLKLIAPEIESQLKATRRTESLALFGASATINRLLATIISKQVDYYTSSFALNEQLIKKIDHYWSQVSNYQQEPEWLRYRSELKTLVEVDSVNGKYQASKLALKSVVNHSLVKASLPPIPGVKNLIMATALELHGACQNSALTRSLLYHLIERIAERSALNPLTQEQQREVLNQPLDSLLANKFFSSQNIDQLVEIAMGIKELGRQNLPEDTSRLGKGILWVGSAFASNSEWVKNLLHDKAQKILNYSAGDFVGKVTSNVKERIEDPDKGLIATIGKIVTKWT